MKTAFLALVLITAFNVQANPWSRKITKLADAINQEIKSDLNKSAEPAWCPGLKLVTSCGNFKCELDKGENAENCAPDCVAASIRSYNQQTLCTEVQKVVAPSNESEVLEIVRSANLLNQKLKVVGAKHSASDLICTKGTAISTEKLKKILGLEQKNGMETVRLEPGVTLAELTEWLHTKGKSIGYPVMGFRGVTIAGAIATSSHGSSVKHSAVISNNVVAMRVITSNGNIQEYSESQTPARIWKSLTTNLGLLGVVTEISLKVQNQKNLRVVTTTGNEKDLLKPNGPFDLVKNCDWGQINWFPGAHSYMKSCGNETEARADPGATNKLIDPEFPGILVAPVKQLMQISACKPNVACMMDQLRFMMLAKNPPFEKLNARGKKVSSHDVIGPSHRMMSSVLTPNQSGFFQMDWEIAVPKSRASAALLAVKAHIDANNICLPLVGVFLRFSPSESKSWLAHTTTGGDFIENEPVVFIEMPVYLPVGFSEDMKASYDSIYENFARMLVEKFGARVHWGKNRAWLFQLERDRASYGTNLDEFRSVVRELDPKGMFANSVSTDLGL